MTLPSSGTISASDVLSDRNLQNNFEVNLNIFRQIAAKNRIEALPDQKEIRWSDFYAKFNEVVTAPAIARVGERYNMTVTGGPPNTRASYTLNGHAGVNSILLDANGNYTFVNMYQIAAGTYTYTFTFSDGHVRSATTVVTQIPKTQPVITLTINVPTYTVGDTGTVTLTAVISPSDPMPTRTIIFQGFPDGNQVLPLNGSNTISVSVPYSNFSAGTYDFVAFYPGDNNYLSGISNTVELIVKPQPVPPKANVYMEYTGATNITVVPGIPSPTFNINVYSDGQVAFTAGSGSGFVTTSVLNASTGKLQDGIGLPDNVTNPWYYNNTTITTSKIPSPFMAFGQDPGTYTVTVQFIAPNSANAYNASVAPSITFTVQVKRPRTFFNADFESTQITKTSYGYDIPGWTIVTDRVYLDGRSQIAGYPTPYDSTHPYADAVKKDTWPMSSDPLETPDLYYDASYSKDIAGYNVGKQSLKLENSGWFASGGEYGVVHGPYLYNTTPAELIAGDVVKFSWRALGGADAYDIFAYLVESRTGAIIPLLDQTGATDATVTQWQEVKFTIGANQGGFYTFVFISGSYDFTGGRLTGAYLLIDQISVNGLSNYY